MPEIIIEQNGKEHKLSFPASMDTMPAVKGLRLATILQTRQQLAEKQDELGLADNAIDYIEKLTGAKRDIVRLITAETAAFIIEQIEELWDIKGYERSYFDIDGVRYMFPRGNQRHLDTTTLGEWSDAMDAQSNFDKLKDGHYEAVLRCMAIYCRPVIEVPVKRKEKRGKWIFGRWHEVEDTEMQVAKYESKDFQARYDLFAERLTMQDIIDFDFFLRRQLKTSAKVFLYSGIEEAQRLAGLLGGSTDG